MRTMRKWLLILALAGSTTAIISCSEDFWQEMRDAAFAGAADFVSDTTFNYLDGTITP